jgi:hypothetical protein
MTIKKNLVKKRTVFYRPGYVCIKEMQSSSMRKFTERSRQKFELFSSGTPGKCIVSTFIFVLISFIWMRVSQTVLLADPIWLRRVTTKPHNFHHTNRESLDDRYPRFKIYI